MDRLKDKAAGVIGVLYSKELIEKTAMVENYSEMEDSKVKSGVGIIVINAVIEASGK